MHRLSRTETAGVAAPEDIDWSLPSFLSWSGGAHDRFPTNIQFRDLAQLYESLKKESNHIKKSYKAFQKSKKSDDADGGNMWSMAALAELVEAIKVGEAMWSEWEVDGDLQTICSKDPKNPACWKTQYKVALLLNAMKDKKEDIYKYLKQFFLPGGDFNNEILYLDDTVWMYVDNQTGPAEIYKLTDPEEKYVLNRDTPVEQVEQDERV